MPNDYDISRAFKRIENDLIDSMMRNLKRHQVEENEYGITWEQWQVLQLQELEQYRQNNIKKFSKEFRDIDRKVDQLFRQTSKDAQAQEEAKILDNIKNKTFTPEIDKGGFFRLNEPKLEALITATQGDFVRAEYAMLRKANDDYRKIIFDSMTYANVTNDYATAVDMATADFLKRGITSVVYKNGARHTVSDYASMALRTGNKRAYLMGEGNAHDRYGLHTVRVNKRQDACPKCVGFLGRILVDDVYGGGTRAEANAQGIPTLSDAMQAGFLHPNCKDMYSVHIPGVSKPPKPWTVDEIEEIVDDYNLEQEIKHAQDTVDTYNRMAKYSLDPSNQAKYQQRATEWQARVDELKARRKPVAPPKPTPKPTPTPVAPTVPPVASNVASQATLLTREDAITKLKDAGFEVDATEFTSMPDELLSSVSQQVDALENKFGAIGKSTDAKIHYKIGGGSTNASVTHRITNPEKQYMTLYSSHYGDVQTLRTARKRNLASKWSMPCLESEFDVYTVTHEYGHMLHNIMLANDLDSFTTFKTRATTYAGRLKSYERYANKKLGEYKKEIIDIAKTLDPNFDIMKELSRYGMKDNAEFFAEVFANSQLGMPNTLGKAMNEWLKGRGYA